MLIPTASNWLSITLSLTSFNVMSAVIWVSELYVLSHKKTKTRILASLRSWCTQCFYAPKYYFYASSNVIFLLRKDQRKSIDVTQNDSLTSKDIQCELYKFKIYYSTHATTSTAPPHSNFGFVRFYSYFLSVAHFEALNYDLW